MIESAPAVVCDAGPLIHLDELDCLDLLKGFSIVWVPSQVWKEVQRHRPRALETAELPLRRKSVTVTDSSRLQALVHAFALDIGEQAALTLMMQFPGAIFLTDDAAARLAAEALGFRVQGSLGILLRAVRRGLRTRTEILDLLRVLPRKSTLHLRKSLLDEIWVEVERFTP